MLSALPQALMVWGLFGALTGAAEEVASDPLAGMAAAWPAVVGGWLAAMIFGCVLQAAIVHGTVADLNGKRASFGGLLQTGLRMLPLTIVLGIVVAIGVWIGVILLIVPGIILSLAWSVAVPVLVVEKAGVFGSLGRSAKLTKGHRWAILGLFVAYMIVAWLLTSILGAVGGLAGLAAAGETGPLVQLIVQQVLSGLVALIATVGVAAVYYELRAAKEGIGAEALASVFD